MTRCPACFGSGEHDFRDSDAEMAEHNTDEELARMRALGLAHPLGIIVCDECEGTGIVTDDRARDLHAAAVAAVDQVVARARENGLM